VAPAVPTGCTCTVQTARVTGTDDHGRTEPPVDGDEAATLLGFLDYQRQTLEWKCAGLDADALRTTVGASSITLGGLLKHMAMVEDGWFAVTLHGRAHLPPFDTMDRSSDPDWEWRTAADDPPESLRALWAAAVERARALTTEALADGGLGRPAAVGWPDGRSASLRWILCHMIEEYARHNGHADFLRESIDGRTGE
jgi:uncharacterized damage-inducible protein DinB